MKTRTFQEYQNHRFSLYSLLFGVVLFAIFLLTYIESNQPLDFLDFRTTLAQKTPLETYKSKVESELFTHQEIKKPVPLHELPLIEPEGSLRENQEPSKIKKLKEKISVEFDTNDTTQLQTVRRQKTTLGVFYSVVDNASLGIEAEKEFEDQGDASTWNKNGSTEEAVAMKYKVQF